MKYARSVIAWILISLAMQFAGLFYINNYFLKTETNFKAKKIEKPAEKPKEIEVSIPQGATMIQVSYDAKYISYYMDGAINVVNTKNGQAKTVKFDDKVKVSVYRWLQDTDRMFIAEKKAVKGDSGIDLTYYDASKDIKDENKFLALPDTKTEATDIQANTVTNVTYVKVNKGTSRNSIYRIDVMKSLDKVSTEANAIGDIKLFHLDDKFAYEDKLHGCVYVSDIKLPIQISGSQSLSLLGIDEDDIIYLGENSSDGKITKVYYGSLEKSTNEWQTINLNSAADKKDIYVSTDGNVYLNNNLKGIVQNLKSGKLTGYTGVMLQMCDSWMVSTENNKIIKTQYK
ncbi:MAG: hypothetical protein Q8936_09120 [Bacillota bacterium]|nr:hypothetical protein [Bacillota bacterium]